MERKKHVARVAGAAAKKQLPAGIAEARAEETENVTKVEPWEKKVSELGFRSAGQEQTRMLEDIPISPPTSLLPPRTQVLSITFSLGTFFFIIKVSLNIVSLD